MYQKEFDQKIQKQLPKAALFFGENAYLIDHYIDLYVQKTDAKESMLTLYHDEWNFDQAKNFLSQTSLFGGTNLLVVKHDKKIPKKELDLLIELTHKNQDNYFLFGYMGSAQDAKSMHASFSDKNNAVWVRFFEPNVRENIVLLQQKAQKIGLDIDHFALQHLLLVLNNNLALSINELDKLAILQMKITSKDIDALVYSTAPLATEALLIDLFHKKPITETITKLLEIGEDEASLLRATQYFVNQIFLFHAYIKLHGTVDSAAILGYKLPPKVEEQKAQLALRIKPATLLKIFEHLLESELLIKQSPATQREMLMYSMLIKVQSFL